MEVLVASPEYNRMRVSLHPVPRGIKLSRSKESAQDTVLSGSEVNKVITKTIWQSIGEALGVALTDSENTYFITTEFKTSLEAIDRLRSLGFGVKEIRMEIRVED